MVLAEELGDRVKVAHCLRHLAMNAILQRDLCAARRFLADSVKIQHDCGHARGMLELSEIVASFALAVREPDRSAALFGFASAQRERLRLPPRPFESAAQTRDASLARKLLGEKAYADACARGRDLSSDQALKEAFEILQSI